MSYCRELLTPLEFVYQHLFLDFNHQNYTESWKVSYGIKSVSDEQILQHCDIAFMQQFYKQEVNVE